MRTIKFRANRIDGLGWVYGYFVKTPITAEFNDVDGAYFDSGKSRYCIVTEYGVAHEVDIATLGQFTGEKDVIGTEIFEGDIVQVPEYYEGDFKNKPEIGLIEFSQTEFYITNVSKTNYHDLSSLTLNEGVKIIGNLYQNPELLEPKN